MARRAAGRWRGALLRGPSGCGKSDLALRTLDAGFRLVADDRVLAWRSGGRAWGRAPDVLAGLLEVRHLGVGRLGAPLPFTEVSLVVDLVDDAPERLPERAAAEVAGVAVPLVRLRPWEGSAVARLAAALAWEGPAL